MPGGFHPTGKLPISTGTCLIAELWPNGEDALATEAIVQNLPNLRRYARALSGKQSSGDAYVAATLEALAQDRSLLEGINSTADTRLVLYKVFTRIWNSTNGKDADPLGSTLPGDRHLGQITPLPRQAFLLITLERFSDEQAAAILDVPVDRVRSLVDESGREIAAAIATDVLIIEDEPMIAMDLENLVEELGHTVIGIARTHSEAVEIGSKQQPGMILADIKLADQSSGLDAVNELLQQFEVPVIFITAYPERYLTGERPEPTFLIPKPFDPTMVSAVISQALFFDRKAKTKPGKPAPAGGRAKPQAARRN
jgi:CheY-like chemotaxis protein